VPYLEGTGGRAALNCGLSLPRELRYDSVILGSFFNMCKNRSNLFFLRGIPTTAAEAASRAPLCVPTHRDLIYLGAVTLPV
jgi:hypothetical protein